MDNDRCTHKENDYFTTCLSCEREKRVKAEEDRTRADAIKKITERAEKLDW